MRPENGDLERPLVLPPGRSYSESFEARLYCFGAARGAALAPGSVIVDVAAERGGNCELTRPGETVHHQGITILGPLNLASSAPYHASQMYSSNVVSFLKLMLTKDGSLQLKRDDEIIRETLVTHAGETVHARVNELLDVIPAEGAEGGG